MQLTRMAYPSNTSNRFLKVPSAVLRGKVGSLWKDLTPKNGILGYGGACTLMDVFASKTQGLHECAA